MILDTNILIGYLVGDIVIIKALTQWRESGAPLFISSISITETLSLSVLTTIEIRTIKTFLEDFIVIFPDANITSDAAELRRTYKISLPDAYIIASALNHRIPLVTRDKQILGLSIVATITI